MARYLVAQHPLRQVGDFYEFKAEGDHRCLFHSLAFLFDKSGVPGELDPDRLRSRLVDAIDQYSYDEDDEHPWGYDHSYRGWGHYLHELRKPTTWGDGNCIRAAARYYGLHIVVYHDLPFEPVVYSYGDTTVNLIYRGSNHYNPLMPASEYRPPESERDRGMPRLEEKKEAKKKKARPRKKPKKHAIRLEKQNSIVEKSCACTVTEMSATPVEVPRWAADKKGRIYDARSTVKLHFCIYAALAGKPFRFLDASPAFINGGKFAGSGYDWFGGSCVKNGRLIGVDDASLNELFTFQELASYGQRALFNDGVAGCRGSIKVLTCPRETTAELRGAAKTTVQVHDGWGYIKRCLADKLQKTLRSRKTVPRRPAPNFQLFQWLDEASDDSPTQMEVVEELIQSGRQRIFGSDDRDDENDDDSNEIDDEGTLDEEEESKGGNVPPNCAAWLNVHPSLATHPLIAELERVDFAARARIYVTTGGPPLLQGVAAPVAADGLVLPQPPAVDPRVENSPQWTLAREAASAGVQSGKIAVFRHPSDRLNWVTTETVDRTSNLAKLLGRMEAIQYTLTGRSDHLVFFKGMLGIIEDDEWPEAWKSAAMVVCNEDQKADERWAAAKDLQTAKDSKATTLLEIADGCLVALRWYGIGALIGIPYALQHQLAGDYDGDLIVLLTADELPKTYEYIRKKAALAPENPKLEKLFTPCDGPKTSRAATIRKIYDARSLVGLWSNAAASVLAAPFEDVARIARKLGFKGGASAVRRDLLLRISRGIKEGTDAFKTKVNVQASLDEVRELADYLKGGGLLAPQVHMADDPLLFRSGEHVPRVLEDKKGLTGWHRRFAVTPRLRGIPAEIMRRTLPAIHPPERKVSPLSAFRDYVPRPTDERELQILLRIKGVAESLEHHDPLDDDEKGKYLQQWRLVQQKGKAKKEAGKRLRFARLAWYALHDRDELTAASWRRVYALFTHYPGEVTQLLEEHRGRL